MSQPMEEDARGDTGALKSKSGADYDALDREIEAQRAVALKEGKISTAIETLLNSEKQMRLAADIVGTRKIVLAIVQLCREMQDWKELNDQIVHFSKRRAQLKQAVSAMVKQCMQYIDETPDLETRIELIKTLNTVSAGKIYVELERARLVRRLAMIKEEQCMIAEAAELMQEIAADPFVAILDEEQTAIVEKVVLVNKDLFNQHSEFLASSKEAVELGTGASP